MNDEEKLLDELKQFPMLAQISEEDMNDLLLLLKKEDFSEGSRFIEENEEGDCMYLLLEGQVDILKTTLYGEEYVCAKLDDHLHCVFGEIAMIDRDRRSATVLAKTDCRTVVLSSEDFRTFCENHPQAGCRLLMVISTNLCRNLRKENENLLKVYSALVEEIENDR